jgi:hypothetical protein
MESLGSHGQVMHGVIGHFHRYLLSEFTQVPAVIQSNGSDRQHLGLPLNCEFGENTVGQHLPAEEVHPYGPGIISSLVCEDDNHFSRTQGFDYPMDDPSVGDDIQPAVGASPIKHHPTIDETVGSQRDNKRSPHP